MWRSSASRHVDAYVYSSGADLIPTVEAIVANPPPSLRMAMVRGVSPE